MLELNEQPQPTLDEWLADWADEVAEGRSRISKAEATRRYYVTYPRDQDDR